MLEDELNTISITPKFNGDKGCGDVKTHSQKRDEKEGVSNNQLPGINCHPFNNPQVKSKTNSPLDLFHLQNKITITEGEEELADSIPVFNLSELQAQAQDPIKFVESVYELGKKYGAIKVIAADGDENEFRKHFQVNPDMFLFQTNKLLNNPTTNEVESRLRFYQELIKFHLISKKKEIKSEEMAKGEAATPKEVENLVADVSQAQNIDPNLDFSVEATPPIKRETTNESESMMSMNSGEPPQINGKAAVTEPEKSTPIQTTGSTSNTNSSTSPQSNNDSKKPRLNLPAYLSKLPMIDKRPIDLYKLFRCVVIRGGFIEVINKKLWAQIGRELGYKGKIMTSLSSSLKTSYLKILYPFETHLGNDKFHIANVDASLIESNQVPNENGKRELNTPEIWSEKRQKPDDVTPLILGSGKDFKRSIKAKASKGFLLNSPHLIETKPISTTSNRESTDESSDGLKKRKKTGGESSITTITPSSQINHALKLIMSNQSIFQDDSRLSLNGRMASIYSLRQFMEKDLKFQEYLGLQNKHYFDKSFPNFGEKMTDSINDQNSANVVTNSINLKTFERLYWLVVRNQAGTATHLKSSKYLDDGLELENGVGLLSFINGSGFVRPGDEFLNYKNSLTTSSMNSGANSNNPMPSNIDSPNFRTASPGLTADSLHLNSPELSKESLRASLSPWNLHNLPTIPNSVLAGLSESDVNNRSIYNPSIIIGMTFSTENWKCEDHFTQLCNFQFFGACKRWYFIPEAEFDKFEDLIDEVNKEGKDRVNVNSQQWNLDAMLQYFNLEEDTASIEYESLMNSLENMIDPYPDHTPSRLRHTNPLFESLINFKRQSHKQFLSNQEFMITPELLQKKGISYTTATQKPGEFIIKFPKTFSSTISFGFNMSEEVNFATKSWFDYALEGEKWLKRQGILPNFLTFKLLVNLSQLYEFGNNRIVFDSETYSKALLTYTALCKNELKLRELIRKKLHNIRELVIDEKTFGDVDSIADDDLANTFPSKVVLTDMKTKQTFIMSLESLLENLEMRQLEKDKEVKSVPQILGNPFIKIELHLFYSDDKLKHFQRVLGGFSIDYDDWMKNYEKTMRENPMISLRNCKSLLSEGEKIYSAISSSNSYNLFNLKTSYEQEDYESIKVNTFKNYIESLRSFVSDANDYIEECQSILSIKHQQRMRNGASINGAQKHESNILERLVKIIDRIPSLNFSCSETDQILEFKTEIENFDRACRSLIMKPKQNNCIYEFEDLINLGQSFGIDLPSLSFLKRLKERLSWIKRFEVIVSGGDPFSESKDIFSLKDLEQFRQAGKTVLGKGDIDKLQLIDRIKVGSLEYNKKLERFLNFVSADEVSFDELERLLSEIEQKAKAEGSSRIFVHIEVYEQLLNLRQHENLIKQFRDVRSSLKTEAKLSFHDVRSLKSALSESQMKVDTAVLDGGLREADNWLEDVSKMLKQVKQRPITTKDYAEPELKLVQKLILSEEVIKQLKHLYARSHFSFSTTTDVYENCSSHLFFTKDDGDESHYSTFYCDCRETEFGTMIECDKCKEWYHVPCVGEQELTTQNDSEDSYTCPMCKLIESNQFSDKNTEAKVNYREFLALLAQGRELKAYPPNELSLFQEVYHCVSEASANLNAETEKLKNSSLSLKIKIDRLRFILRKIYGAPILIEDLSTDLLGTIRKYEYEISTSEPISTVNLASSVTKAASSLTRASLNGDFGPQLSSSSLNPALKSKQSQVSNPLVAVGDSQNKPNDFASIESHIQVREKGEKGEEGPEGEEGENTSTEFKFHQQTAQDVANNVPKDIATTSQQFPSNPNNPFHNLTTQELGIIISNANNHPEHAKTSSNPVVGELSSGQETLQKPTITAAHHTYSREIHPAYSTIDGPHSLTNNFPGNPQKTHFLHQKPLHQPNPTNLAKPPHFGPFNSFKNDTDSDTTIQAPSEDDQAH